MTPFPKRNRSAFANFLRSKYESYMGVSRVESRPYYMGIDPASLCQLRCPFCATGRDNERARAKKLETPPERARQRAFLSGETFDAVLDELGEYLFLITFYNWGEPLLNRNLPAFIRRAAASGIETDINSNLSLPLSDEFIAELLSAGLSHLGGSIDGFSAETYGRARVGGDFALARRNLERIAAARDALGLPIAVTWNFLVFSFNEHEIPAARRYCEKLNIHFNAKEAIVADASWLPSNRRNEEPTLAAARGNIGGFAPTLPQAALGGASCGWHYGFAVVNAEGSLSPCCAAPNEADDMGTMAAGAGGFGEVWNNERYRRARAAFASGDLQAAGKAAPASLCLECPYGAGIQNLYSHYDVKVVAQFQRLYGGREPLLDEGFRLLEDRGRFVRFYQKELINEPH